MAQVLAKVLHGDQRRLAVVDCASLSGQVEWQAVGQQVAPHFHAQPGDPRPGVVLTAGSTIKLRFDQLDTSRNNCPKGTPLG